MGGRQKSLDADIDEQAALDDSLDLAGDGSALVANGEDALPILLELGLLLGENDHAFLVFELLDQDINLVSDFDGLKVFELAGRDDAFTLVADVHQRFFGADFDDGSFNNVPRRKGRFARLPQGFFHSQHNLATNFLR